VYQTSNAKQIGEVPLRFDGPPPPLSLSDDGRWLVVGSGGRGPSLWSVPEAQWVRQFEPNPAIEPTDDEPWRAVAIDPAGETVAAADALNVRLWRIADGNPTRTLARKAGVTDVRFSPGGDLIAFEDTDHAIRVCDRTGMTRHRLTAERDGLFGFSCNEKAVSVASRGLTHPLSVVESDLPPPPLVIDAKAQVNNLTFSPDGRYVAGTTDVTGTDRASTCHLLVWELPGGKEVARLPLIQHGYGGHGRCVFSPDGKFLASGSRDGIHVWTVGDWTKRPTLGSGQYFDIAFTRGSQLIAGVASGQAGGLPAGIRVWEIESGQELPGLIRPLGLRGYPLSLAIQSDRDWIAGGGWTVQGPTDLIVWDGGTRTAKYVLKDFYDGVWCVRFSPDGKLLATGAGAYQGSPPKVGYRDGVVQVWDAETGRLVYDLQGHTACVWSVAFSPDGKRLATAAGKRLKGVRGDARIWDLKTGKELMRLEEHDGAVLGVGFSADGRWFGTTGADQKVRIWDVAMPEDAGGPL
jgi:WD40 repeat protein